MIRANTNLLWVKWIEIPLLDDLIERSTIENHGGQEKFVGEFLIPLLAECGGNNDQKFAFLFCPLLRKENPSLNRFPETDFVGQNRSFRQRRSKRKKCRVDLMRIKVNLRVCQRCR